MPLSSQASDDHGNIRQSSFFCRAKQFSFARTFDYEQISTLIEIPPKALGIRSIGTFSTLDE
jgi:hypothetical protein